MHVTGTHPSHTLSFEVGSHLSPQDSQHKLNTNEMPSAPAPTPNTSSKQMSLPSSMGASRLAPHLDRLVSPQTRQRATEQLTQFARDRPFLAVQFPPPPPAIPTPLTLSPRIGTG